MNLNSLRSVALDHKGQIHEDVFGTIKKRLQSINHIRRKHAFLKVGEMPFLAVRFSSQADPLILPQSGTDTS